MVTLAYLAAARSKVLAELVIYVQMSISVMREGLGLEELIVRIHGGSGRERREGGHKEPC